MLTPHKTNWLLVLLLLTAGLFAAAQFGKLTLTLAALQEVYPDGGLFVPILISIVGVVGIVLGAVAGSVVARFGIARVLTVALVAGGLLSLIQTNLPPLSVFAVLRVLEGLSHLAIVVAVPTLMASIASDDDRPFVMGLWAAFFGIAMAILAAILPTVLATGGLPLVFAGHGGGMLIMAAVLYPLLPKARIAQSVRPRYLHEHRIIYSNPRLIIAGAGFVCYTLIYIALLAVLPIALNPPVWVVTAFPLISILGTLLGGAICKYVSPDKVVATGFMATIAATGLAYVTGAAIWALFLLFLVMAFIPAGSFAAIPHFNTEPTDRARATGGIAQLGNVGTTLGTPIFVLALQLGGLALVCVLITLFCLLGIVLTRMLAAQIK